MRELVTSLGREILDKMKESGVAFTAIETVEQVQEGYRTHIKNDYYKNKIEVTAKAVGPGLWVGGRSSVNSETVLGENVHFLGMHVHGEGALTIGDNFHSGSGCQVITENHNYDNGEAIPYDDTFIPNPVEIGDNVWFGRNVIVLPGVSIAEGAVIQTGSVVTKDVPKGAIAGGHPVEVFDTRDMDHYETLKAAGRFY